MTRWAPGVPSATGTPHTNTNATGSSSIQDSNGSNVIEDQGNGKGNDTGSGTKGKVDTGCLVC